MNNLGFFEKLYIFTGLILVLIVADDYIRHHDILKALLKLFHPRILLVIIILLIIYLVFSLFLSIKFF